MDEALNPGYQAVSANQESISDAILFFRMGDFYEILLRMPTSHPRNSISP
jgi:DNA mismatch repair ATPase MutS